MRRSLIWTIAGLVLLLAMFVGMRGRGIGAVDHRPWPLEPRVAKAMWRHLVPTDIRGRTNPVADTADVLKNAREHWAGHCATCHANDGSGDMTIGRRVYPRAPDMRAELTQRISDGELFYAIEQGIPWTAMPGWSTGTPEGEQESWTLVRFIRHLPSLTADELKDMERLNPKPPPNEQREQEIEDFLKGPPKRGRGQRGGG